MLNFEENKKNLQELQIKLKELGESHIHYHRSCIKNNKMILYALCL